MIATPQPAKMTAADYLIWEAQQETRHEFVAGNVVAMTGGSIAPNELALPAISTSHATGRSVISWHIIGGSG